MAENQSYTIQMNDDQVKMVTQALRNIPTTCISIPDGRDAEEYYEEFEVLVSMFTELPKSDNKPGMIHGFCL